MSARQKNKHKSRHRTHEKKPASLPRTSLAKSRVIAEAEPEVVVEAAPAATKKKTAAAATA